jgi:hypothetical protein
VGVGGTPFYLFIIIILNCWTTRWSKKTLISDL